MAFLRPAAHHVQIKTAHAAEQQRYDVKAAREGWFEGQLDLDPERLTFIDETGAIEMAFSKFKAFLRAAAARTIPDLWEAIRVALDTFTPSECQNFFAAAGYDAI